LHHYLSSKPPRGFDITEAWHQPAGYKVNHEKAAKGTAVGSELELIFGLFHSLKLYSTRLAIRNPIYSRRVYLTRDPPYAKQLWLFLDASKTRYLDPNSTDMNLCAFDDSIWRIENNFEPL
jgi:hypothetical protein